jgi:hypothetical protein
MERKWISLIAAALIAVAAVAPVAAQEDPVTVSLDEVNESRYSGTVTLTPENDQTVVSISLVMPAVLDDENGEPIELAIHEGTCDDPGEVAHELEAEAAGLSVTTVDASIDELTGGGYLIALHEGGDAENGLLACGELAAAPDEEDDAAVDEEDDAVVDEEDDAVADDEDDAVVDEEDDAAVDEEDDAVVDDEDDAVVDDAEADDSEELVPAAGSTGGFSLEAGALMLTLAAGATLGAGLLIRRRSLQF